MIGEARGRILAAWVERLGAEKLLLGLEESVLDAWLSYLGPALDGDAGAERELHKQVAFHTRELGLEGRPSSIAVLQVALLEDAIIAALGSISPAVRRAILDLMRIAADAHSLGDTERRETRHQREIRDFTPLIRVDGAVVAFLLGPMVPELIDSMAGRLLRDCAATGARTAVIDLLGAEVDDDRFHRTIEAMMKTKPGVGLTLILTGLRDPDGTRQKLGALGVDLSRVRFEASVNDVLPQRS